MTQYLKPATCPECGRKAFDSQARFAEMAPVQGIRSYEMMGITYLHEDERHCDVTFRRVERLETPKHIYWSPDGELQEQET